MTSLHVISGLLPPQSKILATPMANRQRFQIFHPTLSLSHKNFLLGKTLMTSFHVICGLGLPQSKILGTLMSWRSPEKKFCRLFLEHLRLRSWPRAFLSLASRGSVLGKAVLGLGFFLCPWPRTFCPRLHLWCW